jgi:eukaryotic-like serine/threonine-protein kinase
MLAVRAGCLDENTIAAFFRSKLSPGELAAIDAHIDRCADCRVLLSSLAAREVSVGPFSATEFSSRWQRNLDGEPVMTPLTAPVARLSTGDVLAERFVIEARVGAGGMAEVYRARDRAASSTVAVKVPFGAGSSDCARFDREARLLVQLSHPAIVKHTANGRLADDTPFLAMEWLEGEDLAERLKNGPLGVDDTLALGIRVAGALAAAHAVGTIHRDIKPSNIFLRDRTVRGATLIDFGVARQQAPEAASLATRTGTLLGTLGYMAPEQALGAKTADGRADTFSLGCVLFECLTGRRLFVGAHAVEVLAKLLTEPVPSPKSLTPAVPGALDALVLQMLERDPAKRPVDCAAIAAELERIRAAGPDAAPAVSRAPRPRRGRAGWAIAVLAVAAGGGALAMVRTMRSSPTAPKASTATSIAIASPDRATATATPTATPTATATPPATATLVTTAAITTARVDAMPARPSRPRAPSSSSSADPFGNSRN